MLHIPWSMILHECVSCRDRNKFKSLKNFENFSLLKTSDKFETLMIFFRICAFFPTMNRKLSLVFKLAFAFAAKSRHQHISKFEVSNFL